MAISGHQRDSAKDKYWELLDVALETDGVWSTWIGYGISGGTTSASWSSGSDRRYRTRRETADEKVRAGSPAPAR